MESEYVRLAQQAILLTVIVSAPPVLAALLVGLSVALFQALTQIQEQTLSMVGRIVAIFTVLGILGYWMASLLLQFSVGIFENFSQWVS